MLALWFGFGCLPAGQGHGTGGQSGGASGKGGSGGSQSGGGAGQSTGGTTSSGGTTAKGGSAGNGGTGGQNSGGTTSSGGNQPGGSGGQGTGGTTSSGGQSSGGSGGQGTGGSQTPGGSGGTPSGGGGGTKPGGTSGAAGTGGGAGTGGASGTGGSRTGGAGGTLGTGGNRTGGTTSSGGSMMTGGTTTTGGTSAAGGTTTTGGTTGTASCLDGKMNGDETGVDCGGSCPACPNYKVNPPNLKNSAATGCQGGPGFMCSRSMVFSPEFKQAAMDDWSSPDPPFVYGAVGHDKDSGGVDGNANNTCCQCYQLVFESPRDAVTGLPTPKPMIVQTFNTAAGGGKNFDIYMATGGEGANTAGCTAQYDQYPSVGQPSNGGVRVVNFSSQCASKNLYSLATVSTSTCQDYIASQCDQIKSSSASTQADSQTSCIEASQPENLYHLNWSVRAKRVECPVNLTRVTGCKLVSQGLPEADPTAKDAASAGSFATGYSTTTMEDCCRPTCGWNANVTQSGVGVDSGYGAFYTCDKAGNPS